MERKEFIKKEIEQDPQNPFNHYLLALEYKKEGIMVDAIQLFEKLIVEFPNYIPTYYSFADYLIENELDDKAEIVLLKGIEMSELAGNTKALKELKQLLALNF
ncbi:tetratricopeptide repeat protein [Aquirufa rosea]|uniref:Tetratricopeptide repeat protein n=1 Tax=Aquirufa rosea TaxID=2509241 RepID=A0A4Q1C207_9BACT|nr:tetratricopeptide repeat protein [Aquirufa rosea]RXK52254.1 tetratricopeptide repeat protein [Aquirufa rosea]